MRLLYRVFLSLSLLIAVSSTLLAAPCSNQIQISYYNTSGVLTTASINNGQTGTIVPVCPSPNGLISLQVGSTSDAQIKVVAVRGTQRTTLLQGAVLGSQYLTLSANISAATTLEITSLTINCNGGTASNMASVTIQPSLALSSNVSSVCSGGSVTATASGSTTGTYTWYLDGVLQPETGATITRNNITTAPTFTVTANAQGCGITTQTLTVPLSALSVAPAAPTVCPGSSTPLTASYNGTSATFRWYNNATNALLQTTTGATSSTYTPPALATTTTYRVEAQTSDCSTLLSQTVTVTVGALTASASPGTTTVCTNSPVTLTATSNNPNATYQWQVQSTTPQATWSNITGATDAIYSFVTGTTTITRNYRVVVSAASCTSVTTGAVAVTNIASATNTVSPASATMCAGNATTFTASSNTTNPTYRWYATPSQVLSTSATLTASPTATTTYTVEVNSGGCGISTFTRTVTVNPLPTVSVSANPSTASNSPQNVTLTMGGAATYTITATTGSGPETTLVSNTSATTYTTSQNGSTTYKVTGFSNTNPSCSSSNSLVVSLVLPVELSSFSAAWQGTTPLVRWATATEKNSLSFQVERSFDGRTFTPVGSIAAAGTSVSPRAYTFADARISKTAATTVYYRLRQLDVDGTAHLTEVRTLRGQGGQGLQASAFPNPFDASLQVTLSSPTAGPVQLVLHDVLGKRVLTHNLLLTANENRTVALPLPASLPRGIYFLRLTQNGEQQTVKLNH